VLLLLFIVVLIKIVSIKIVFIKVILIKVIVLIIIHKIIVIIDFCQCWFDLKEINIDDRCKSHYTKQDKSNKNGNHHSFFLFPIKVHLPFEPISLFKNFLIFIIFKFHKQNNFISFELSLYYYNQCKNYMNCYQ
jgi:hypothetical protein